MTREHYDAGDFEFRRALRDLGEGAPAPASARERLSSALRLASVSAPFASRRAPSPPRTWVSPTGLASHGAFAWVLGGVGFAALIGAWLTLGPLSAARSTLPPRALPLPEEETRVENDEPMRAPPNALPVPNAPTPLSIDPPAPESKSEKRATRDASLGAERRLLDAARTSLVAGDIPAGLERLAKHARQFPHGALAEEREALSIDALVAVGRYEEARRRADAFRVRHPGSLFAPSVAAALKAIP